MQDSLVDARYPAFFTHSTNCVEYFFAHPYRFPQESLLKKYQGWKKKITLLEYERSNPSKATKLEVLGGLALARPLIEGPVFV